MNKEWLRLFLRASGFYSVNSPPLCSHFRGDRVLVIFDGCSLLGLKIIGHSCDAVWNVTCLAHWKLPNYSSRCLWR